MKKLASHEPVHTPLMHCMVIDLKKGLFGRRVSREEKEGRAPLIIPWRGQFAHWSFFRGEQQHAEHRVAEWTLGGPFYCRLLLLRNCWSHQLSYYMYVAMGIFFFFLMCWFLGLEWHWLQYIVICLDFSCCWRLIWTFSRQFMFHFYFRKLWC